NGTTQQVTTLINTGLYQPRGLALDGSGNLYIVDFLNDGIQSSSSVIKKWTASTQLLTTVFRPNLVSFQLAVDGSGNIYVASGGAAGVGLVKWTAATQQMTVFPDEQFNSGVARDLAANLYTSRLNRR